MRCRRATNHHPDYLLRIGYTPSEILDLIGALAVEEAVEIEAMKKLEQK